MVEIPPAILPICSTANINESILLYKGSLQLVWSGQDAKAFGEEGSVQFECIPFPKVKFQIHNVIFSDSIEGLEALIGADDNLTIELTDVGVVYRAHITKQTLPSIAGSIYGVIHEFSSYPESGNLTYAISHIINSQEMLGNPVYFSCQKLQVNCRQVFQFDDWKITMDCSPNFIKHKKAKKVPEYTFTHTLKLEKACGNSSSEFTVEQASEILDLVGYFMSFVQGRWISCFPSFGFDNEGRQVWESWEPYKVSKLKNASSWFCGDYTSDGLVDVFEGFQRLWKDKDWRENLIYIINWYVNANTDRDSVEGKIIWVQSALELLSFTYFCMGKNKSPNKFKKDWNLQDKLCKLLESLEISTSLKEEFISLPNLIRFIEQNSLQLNGVEALVYTRNAITHPGNTLEIGKGESKRYVKIFEVGRGRHVRTLAKVRIDILQLGLLYLELSLLKLFDYSGKYVNRLKPIGIEDMPQVNK